MERNISPVLLSSSLPQNVGRTVSIARANVLAELEGELEEDLLMDFDEVGDHIEGVPGTLDKAMEGELVSSLVATPRIIHKVNWVEIPMDKDSSLGGELSLQVHTRLASLVEVTHSEIRKEVVAEDPSMRESIEIVSLVGGRALETPMLFRSPDPYLRRRNFGSYTRMPI